MKHKEIAKKLISQHFEIGSLLIEEAIQCALITAYYINDIEVIKELQNIKLKEEEHKSELDKYWQKKPANVVAKQIELFI